MLMLMLMLILMQMLMLIAEGLAKFGVSLLGFGCSYHSVVGIAAPNSNECPVGDGSCSQ